MSDLTFKRIKDITGSSPDIDGKFFAMDSNDKGTQKVELSEVLNKITYVQNDLGNVETVTIGKVKTHNNQTGIDVVAPKYYDIAMDTAEISESSDKVPSSALVHTALAGKVDVVSGASLMTGAEHIKLEGIEAGAQANVIESINGVSPAGGNTDLELSPNQMGLPAIAKYTGTYKDKIITATYSTGTFNGNNGDIIYLRNSGNANYNLAVAANESITVRIIKSGDNTSTDFILNYNGTTNSYQTTWFNGQIIELVCAGDSILQWVAQGVASTSEFGITKLENDVAVTSATNVAVTPAYVSARAANNITTTNWLDKVYPVGSIYLTLSFADPNTTFGGNWQRIEGKFLLAAGGTYSAFAEGGSATTQIATTNLPKITGETANSPSLAHYHKMNYSETTGSGSNRATPVSWNDSTGNKVATSTSYKSGDEATLVHKHSFTINNGGDNPTALNTMPPYLVVYAWVRLADNETEISSLQTTQEEEIEVN